MMGNASRCGSQSRPLAIICFSFTTFDLSSLFSWKKRIESVEFLEILAKFQQSRLVLIETTVVHVSLVLHPVLLLMALCRR